MKPVTSASVRAARRLLFQIGFRAAVRSCRMDRFKPLGLGAKIEIRGEGSFGLDRDQHKTG